MIANATGCSSVYASTFPFNPYNDPWVNSLFQDTPAVAKGIFEGLAAEAVEDVRALRTAKLELADEYDPQVHDKLFRTLGWSDFTAEELALMPTVFSIGGDGATYDIGFGSLSRVLATSTPIKTLVLNTGVYSNTGGQTSTASLTGQDSDLSRFGAAHSGKQEARKELGLIAAFHPNVFVVQASTALQGHFLNATMQYLAHNDAPAVLDVYTPCQAEHGIADAAASQHARMAVESRMNPVFVHDPRRGSDLHSRFVLDGNPDVDKDWATTTIEYVEDGATKLKEVPYTPADFARTETRFKKQFRKLADGADGVEIAEYVDLPEAERAGKTPFVWATDADRRRWSGSKSPRPSSHLVQERRKYWRTLQYLAGVDVARLDESHRAELEALQAQYKSAVAGARNLARLHRQGDVRAGGVLRRAGERLRGLADAGCGAAPAGRGTCRCRRQRCGSGPRRRGGPDQVQQLQDLLPGPAGAVREDQDDRRRRPPRKSATSSRARSTASRSRPS